MNLSYYLKYPSIYVFLTNLFTSISLIKVTKVLLTVKFIRKKFFFPINIKGILVLLIFFLIGGTRGMAHKNTNF